MEQTNATWNILSPNLMLFYGSYMSSVGLKRRRLLFLSTLSYFYPIMLWLILYFFVLLFYYELMGVIYIFDLHKFKGLKVDEIESIKYFNNICDLWSLCCWNLFVSFIKDFLHPCKYGEDALDYSFDLELCVNDDGKALN
jgi:hypothetical protein